MRHPRGVVGVIGPWNLPLLNNYGDCVGPLVAGNAVVLKPSDTTPLTSLRVARALEALGLPDGRVRGRRRARRGGRGATAARRHDLLHRQPGRRQAGGGAPRPSASSRRCWSWGAKSAMIVLADADLPRAAHAAVWSAFAGSGQVCVRTERVLVEAPVADRFMALVDRGDRAPARRRRPGARARRGDLDVGAITFPPQIARAEAQIADAVARGARVLTGGRAGPSGGGQFFPPTLLADATPEWRSCAKRPSARCCRSCGSRSADEALRIANDSPLGLTGSVWSADVDKARALARRIATGTRARERRPLQLLLRRGAPRRDQGQRLRLPPRRRGSAAVLPDRDRSSRTTRCSAGSRPSSRRQLSFPYQGAHEAPLAPVHAPVLLTATESPTPRPSRTRSMTGTARRDRSAYGSLPAPQSVAFSSIRPSALSNTTGSGRTPGRPAGPPGTRSAHPRHHRVEQNETRARPGAQKLHRLLAVGGRLDLVPRSRSVSTSASRTSKSSSTSKMLNGDTTELY